MEFRRFYDIARRECTGVQSISQIAFHIRDAPLDVYFLGSVSFEIFFSFIDDKLIAIKCEKVMLRSR